MIYKLKESVLKANLELVKYNLVLLTWGNVSQIDKETGLVYIKPSGVSYNSMTADDIVVVDLQGNVVDGRLKPSSDMPSHLEIYKAFPNAGGIVHTHSTYATAFAQAGKAIPVLGTTHADYFYRAVPCARELSRAEVNGEYESNTGKVIAETFKDEDSEATPACLVKNHGVFAWGKDAGAAVHNAVVLEEVAKMAFLTLAINPSAGAAADFLIEKHYDRKHGKCAYYGQKEGK